MRRVAIAALGLLALAPPARAQVAIDVTQTPPPPWRPGTEVVVGVRARNLGGPAGAVEFTIIPRPELAPVFLDVSPLQFGCAPGSFGALNEPPYSSWQLGVLPAGAAATCSIRFRVDADATPGSAEWVFAGLTQTPGTVFDPPFVIAPFGVAPAPASVPATSSWSLLALAMLAFVTAIRSRRGTGRRRRPAAATPTRRASA